MSEVFLVFKKVFNTGLSYTIKQGTVIRIRDLVDFSCFSYL